MNKIGDTELIINDENRVYHLNLQKHEIANNIILSHGGKLELLSSPLGGLRVKLSMPL